MSDTGKRFIVYAYLMTHKDRTKFSPSLIEAHVAHLKRMQAEKRLVLCGPFLDYKGGMVVVRAASTEEAGKLAERDPFISSGFESYELRTLQIACEENKYLL